MKLHEVAVAAIIKAHRRNETKLYQTLMAYLRLTQADQAALANPPAGQNARASSSPRSRARISVQRRAKACRDHDPVPGTAE